MVPPMPISVTLILVAYNHEQFILEALKSAFDQDYPNLRIVICDDCSSDSTVEKIMEFLAQTQVCLPYELIFNRERFGFQKFFNHIHTLIHADYYIYSSGDDVCHPKKVSESVSLFLGTACAGITSEVNYIDSKGSSIPAAKLFKTPNVPQRTELNLNYHLIALSDVFLRSILPIPEGEYAEDQYLMRLAMHGSSWRLNHSMEKLVSYRIHSASVTGKLNQISFKSFKLRKSFQTKTIIHILNGLKPYNKNKQLLDSTSVTLLELYLEALLSDKKGLTALLRFLGKLNKELFTTCEKRILLKIAVLNLVTDRTRFRILRFLSMFQRH